MTPWAEFECEECGRVWPDEMPPLWMEDELELWPVCCDQRAKLVEPLISAKT